MGGIEHVGRGQAVDQAGARHLVAVEVAGEVQVTAVGEAAPELREVTRGVARVAQAPELPGTGVERVTKGLQGRRGGQVFHRGEGAD